MNPEAVVEVIVQRISPKPGELVVLTFPDHLTLEQSNRIKESWEHHLPGFPCIVMSGGGHVSGVVSTDEVAS